MIESYLVVSANWRKTLMCDVGAGLVRGSGRSRAPLGTASPLQPQTLGPSGGRQSAGIVWGHGRADSVYCSHMA